MSLSFFNPSKSFAHILIVVCIFVAILGFSSDKFLYTFSLYPIAYQSNIFHTVSQGIVFQFLHGSLLHLLFNCYALWYCGPEVEARMTKKRFILFFVFSTLVLVFSILFFSESPVIGISGFCMALLSYLAIDLYNTRHPAFMQVCVILVINILIGLHEGISFIGHFFGAIAGVIYWYILVKNPKIFD